jgi:thymidylate synthase
MADEKRAMRSDAIQIPRIPAILVRGETIGEAYHHALIACYEQGLRIETPKHREGLPLGYDAHVTVEVSHPTEEPMLHKKSLNDDARGLMQYILEVTHGIHDHWIKDPEDPEDAHWGYTYHKRFKTQIPFAFGKAKKDYTEKGRVSGRDYFFSTWRPQHDSILEQPDPPCFQNGQMRFIRGNDGKLNLHYLNCWRSRDDVGAWNENNVAQVRLMKLLAAKASSIFGEEVKPGYYTDTSTSLHIYGSYLDKIASQIEEMRRGRVGDFTMSLEDYLGDEASLKRIIAAQMDYEAKTTNKNASEQELKENGYDLATFAYPAEWDTWPKEWDIELDPKLLKVD